MLKRLCNHAGGCRKQCATTAWEASGLRGKRSLTSPSGAGSAFPRYRGPPSCAQCTFKSARVVEEPTCTATVVNILRLLNGQAVCAASRLARRLPVAVRRLPLMLRVLQLALQTVLRSRGNLQAPVLDAILTNCTSSGSPTVLRSQGNLRGRVLGAILTNCTSSGSPTVLHSQGNLRGHVQGAIVNIPLFALMRSEDNWEDALKFIPERFLQEGAEIALQRDRQREPEGPAQSAGNALNGQPVGEEGIEGCVPSPPSYFLCKKVLKHFGLSISGLVGM